MKEITSFVALILLLTSGSFAQKTSNTRFFMGTSLGFPITQLDYNGYSSNYNFGGGVAGGLSFALLPRVNFRTTISYHQLRFDEQRFAQTAKIQNSSFAVDGGPEKLVGLMGDFKYSFRSSTYNNTPYIFGGYGAYRLTERNIEFHQNGPISISNPYHYWAQTLKGGIGIDINRFKALGFFSEISITASFPEGSDSSIYLPLTLGITF